MADTKHNTIIVAEHAFEQLTHGLATGDWSRFLDVITDDFSLWFPLGPYHGLNVGKERAREFFNYVTETFPEGLKVIVDRVISSDNTVVFEFHDEGKLRGEPYKNRVAVFFEVRGDKICGYREYFGSDGKSY